MAKKVVKRKAKAGSQKKIVVGICLVLGLALIVMFFMPWTKLSLLSSASRESSASANVIGTANGWQLAMGDMTSGDMTKAEGQDADSFAIRARPWFILGIVLPVTMLAVGVLSLLKKLRARPAGLTIAICGGLGVLLALSVLTVDYNADFNHASTANSSGADVEMAELMLAFFDIVMPTSVVSGVWASLVFCLMAGFFGMWLFSMGKPKAKGKAMDNADDQSAAPKARPVAARAPMAKPVTAQPAADTPTE